MRQQIGPPDARVRRIAGILSLGWTGLVLAYAIGYVGTLSPGGGELVLLIAGLLGAVIVPVGLIWAVVWLYSELLSRHGGQDGLAGQMREMREEIARQDKRLKTAEQALRKAQADLQTVRAAQSSAVVPAPPPPRSAEQRPKATDSLVATVLEEQPDLPLEGAHGPAPLTLDETIRALNFPQDADDRAGFDVLKRALASHELARLLQASEDCLNLLAHEGLYMDDLFPAPASADDWRQFAKGGAARAALLPLNGIRDDQALETVRTAMRADPIFRDTALHFQRQFDQMLSGVAAEADDRSLLDLVDTRSGRAFVLLVQASGPEGRD